MWEVHLDKGKYLVAHLHISTSHVHTNTKKEQLNLMKKSVIVFLMVLLLGACSSEQEKVIFPTDNSTSLKPIMQKQDSIHGYKGVINEEDILVAIYINRFDRFNKTKIEEKITKQIEKKFPEKKVLVTGDQKIIWEVESIIDKKLKEEDLRKSIEKIKSLSKEET